MVDECGRLHSTGSYEARELIHMDIKSKEARSFNMSRIRSKNTRPEMIVCKYLFSRGLRYRKNNKRLPGKPDLVFPRYRTVVFVHGCFWHKHIGCRYFVLPETNADFWKEKLEANRQRDESNTSHLNSDGWRVITVWECELRKHIREDRLARLYNEIIF